MKVACAMLPSFEATVEVARLPELAGKPVVVGGLPHERRTVRSCSPEAAAAGVVEGMTLREAQGRCPDAVFIPPDDALYRKVMGRVLTTVDAFSPRVEAAGYQSSVISHQLSVISRQSTLLVFADASGLEMLFGPDGELGERIAAAVEARATLHPQVGIGSGKFVAQMAAMRAAPGTAVVVKPGDERAFLAPLPVEWLPCSAEMRRRLDLFGLRTMGQLADLPRGALGEQFGKEGAEISRLARGIDERPVVARALPSILREEVEIDPPAGESHLLLAAAGRIAGSLERRMRSGYVACQEVTLDLGFDGGLEVRLSTALHEPTDRAGDLLRAVERLLSRAYARLPAAGPEPSVLSPQFSVPSAECCVLPASSTQDSGLSTPSPFTLLPSPFQSEEVPGVVRLSISLSGFGGQWGEQMELIPTAAGRLRKVRQAMQQAEELFGAGAIHPLEEPGYGRPAAGRIGVMAEADGRPHVLFIDGRRDRVREISNRWRVQEDWWRREVLREYYRLITASGKLCLIFRDLIGGGWYLERIYG